MICSQGDNLLFQSPLSYIISMGTIDKRDFNLAAKIILGFTSIFLVLEIVSNIITARTYNLGGFGSLTSTLLSKSVIDILLIISAVLILRRSKGGLLLFIVFSVLRLFTGFAGESNASYAYLLGGNFVYFVRDFVPFAIAMCFKKNGISGWNAFFADDNFIESHFNSDDRHDEKLEELNNNDLLCPNSSDFISTIDKGIKE